MGMEAIMPAKTKTTDKPKSRSTAHKAGRHDPRRTKAGAILDLLKRAKGASIADLQKATGWKPHSVRAALTGLRKKGHDVQREKDAKSVTVYSVASGS